MTLDDLARFTIRETTTADEAGFVLVHGTFNHLEGVAKTRGWLYHFKGPQIDGWVIELDDSSREAVFRTEGIYVQYLELQPGHEFFWIDSYWDATEIDRILDPHCVWDRTLIEANDSVAISRVPDGTLESRLKPGGWDHKHCRLCLTSIEVGEPIHSNKEFLVCTICFERYVIRHDLGFMANFWPQT